MKKVFISTACILAVFSTNAVALNLDELFNEKSQLEVQISNKTNIVNAFLNDFNAKNSVFSSAFSDFNTTKEQNQALQNSINELKNINLKLEQSIKNNDIKLNFIENDLLNKNASLNSINAELNIVKQELEQKKTELNYDKIQNDYHNAIEEHSEFLKDYDTRYQNASESEKKVLEEQRDALVKKQRDAAAVVENAVLAISPIMLKIEQINKDIFNSKDSISKLENEKTQLTNDKAKLEENIKNNNNSILENENKITSNDLASKETILENAKNELEKAKNDLNLAKEELEKLNHELNEIYSQIATNTTEGQKIKESLGDIGSSSKSHELISILAKGDKASVEERAKSQVLVDKIANDMLNDMKDDINSDTQAITSIQINNMNKRLGEIRGLGSELGAWGRFYGGKMSNSNDHFYYNSWQIGFDNLMSNYNGDLILGIMGGYDKINASISSKSYSLGFYGSYLYTNNVYTDTTVKYIHTLHDKDGYSIKNQKSLLASFELGYRMDLARQMYFEPSIEFITGKISKYESKKGNVTVSVDSYYPAIFKPQAFVGMHKDEFIFRIGGGAVINTKNQEAKLAFNIHEYNLKSSSKINLKKNDYGFVSIGGAYNFDNNLRLNASLERSFDGELTNDYEFNTTIRYTF